MGKICKASLLTFFSKKVREEGVCGKVPKPLRPRRPGQSFGPEPLCRFATSPRAAGTHPLTRGPLPHPCGGSGALGGAQRAPPVCCANPLLRLIALRGQSLCAPQFRCAQLWPHAHNPALRRNSGNFLWFFLLLAKERTSSRGAVVPGPATYQKRRTRDIPKFAFLML